MDRRRFLQTAAVSGIASFGLPFASHTAARPSLVNDVSQLNPVRIAREVRPRSADDVRAALRGWAGGLCVGGGRYSMGGQIAAAGALHFDLRAMNQVVDFDAARRTIRVQAGMTWRDVQDIIDPHDLSVKIMQSYSNFTVGGSVSVNCHGRYVGKGPLVNSVRALQLVTADGGVLELSRTREPELFRAVFGGYGGLGVIAEVELDLDANVRMEREMRDVTLEAYPEYFLKNILPDPRVVLHNADLTAPDFAAPRITSWVATDKPLTVPDRLVRRGLDYKLAKNALWAITELPGGWRLRDKVIDRKLFETRAVVWRNHEASLDAASLEPRTRAVSTYVLQEYFIPVANFVPFARDMARVLKTRGVEAVNVSIRHSPADGESLLRWAPTDVFSFVLYYKQRTGERASRSVTAWTRELVDRAIANGGRYFLPYRLDATTAQFERAYPEAPAFAALKSRIDPRRRFSNLLWEKYLPAA